MAKCLYNIPICGGFCAPTENPDKSCFRHFSNEYTIPARGPYMKIGHVIEWSRCCIFCGSRGFPCAHRNRKTVMAVAVGVNLFMWGLLIYPVFGLSLNADQIKNAAWATGEARNEGQEPFLNVYVGLKARVDEIDCKRVQNRSTCESAMAAIGSSASVQWPFDSQGDGVYSRVVEWSSDGSCPEPGSGLDVGAASGPTPGPQAGDACRTCQESVGETVTFAIMGVITQIPTIATNMQRSTAFGDVNCQATMGFVSSFFGCFSALMTLRSFSMSCWRNLEPESSGSPITVEWQGGAAFWCLVAASVLKLWDAFSHLATPTPPGRHSKPPAGSTLVGFMELGVEKKEETEA